MNPMRFLLAAICGILINTTAVASDQFITIASTTSTENSGLFAFLLPEFKAKTRIDVRVVAVGTGQAIRNARNGDADVLFVHHKPSEEKFVNEGFGVQRYDVMYNDFVLIGPASDPAGIAGNNDIVKALGVLADTESVFASRGDDSGTNKKELGLWREANVDTVAVSGSWYRETGSGMGATLNTASAMNAYVLSDRATWLNFGNKGELKVLVEGDARLFNQYGVILVNPEKHTHVKTAAAQTFIDWLISSEGQTLINQYRINDQQAFFANAEPVD